MNELKAPVARFTNRVENYLKFRPGYPRAVVDELKRAGALRAESVVADLGSGTGFLAELFLRTGNVVYGVEPNDAMRVAGEEHLRGYQGFHGIAAPAEATTLPDSSIDLVTIGQALHWFDAARTRQEILRIAKAPQWVAVVYNDRNVEASGFMHDYEALLVKHAPEYLHLRARPEDHGQLNILFADRPMQIFTIPNRQQFDLDGFIGRVLSSSYAPAPGEEGHTELVTALRMCFMEHAKDDKVSFEYVTSCVYGTLAV